MEELNAMYISYEKVLANEYEVIVESWNMNTEYLKKLKRAVCTLNRKKYVLYDTKIAWAAVPMVETGLAGGLASCLV